MFDLFQYIYSRAYFTTCQLIKVEVKGISEELYQDYVSISSQNLLKLFFNLSHSLPRQKKIVCVLNLLNTL